MNQPLDIFSDEFARQAFEAGFQARQESLAAGLPVFFLDSEGRNVMELPDGRIFLVRFIPGAPMGKNYEVLREIRPAAAA